MNEKIIYSLFLSVFTIAGLNACNDKTSVEQPKEFYGKWNGVCESGSNSYSFTQEWVIGSTNRDIKIKLWKQPNCPSNVASSTVVLKSVFFSSNRHTLTSNLCKKGFAIKTDTKLGSFNDGNQIISINTDGKNTDKKIRDKLVSLNISNILPRYDLICLDTQGRLRIGNLETGNGSTEEKRPKEIDSVKSYSKK